MRCRASISMAPTSSAEHTKLRRAPAAEEEAIATAAAPLVLFILSCLLGSRAPRDATIAATCAWREGAVWESERRMLKTKAEAMIKAMHAIMEDARRF